MRFAGAQRKVVALILLTTLAALSWLTMDPGRPRWLVAILLAGFALRIMLGGSATGGGSQTGAGSL